ncbi:transposase [Streptomyces acidiscabies]|uniref:transposase n=1 Tax=Streptomyces acidiscabies TaxID=42234 RepID=UPI0038F65061
MRRLLAGLDDKTLMKIAKVRRHVWMLLRLRPGGFPRLTVAGRRPTGRIVIDLDATVITSASRKEGAAATFKGTFGFHPLDSWLANTGENLAMELRAGNAGANTVDDHIRVLAAALDQIPHSSRSKILVRVDGAGATHGLLEHLEALNTKRRTARYTVGWKITPEDEVAVAKLPESARETSLKQDGDLQAGYQVAELTGLNTRDGWPQGMRLIVRRVRLSRRHMKKLTAFEQKTGWRYSITATNIRHMRGIAGSRQIQFLDALHRDHAEVEDRVRTGKAMGLANLPSQSWQVNTGWMLAANLAADLDTWLRLLTLHDQDGLEDAEPDTIRLRLCHLPARLARHCPPSHPARRADLAVGSGVHHQSEQAHPTSGRHLAAGSRPAEDQEGGQPATSGPVEPGAPAASRDGLSSNGKGHYGRTVAPLSDRIPLTNRG